MWQNNASTNIVTMVRGGFANLNSQALNVPVSAQFTSGIGASASGTTQSTVDTSSAQTISITLQVGTATDTTELDAGRIVIYPN